jgi:hypothetical protein
MDTQRRLGTSAYYLFSLLAACGGTADMPPPSGGGAPSECDQYDFLVAFQHSDNVHVVEINCQRIISPVEWINQSFTEYANGKTTLTYWANSLPVRVDGAAPDCIKARLNEDVPRKPLTPSECKRTPIR